MMEEPEVTHVDEFEGATVSWFGGASSEQRGYSASVGQDHGRYSRFDELTSQGCKGKGAGEVLRVTLVRVNSRHVGLTRPPTQLQCTNVVLHRGFGTSQWAVDLCGSPDETPLKGTLTGASCFPIRSLAGGWCSCSSCRCWYGACWPWQPTWWSVQHGWVQDGELARGCTKTYGCCTAHWLRRDAKQLSRLFSWVRNVPSTLLNHQHTDSTTTHQQYAFKILPCAKRTSHDWTTCPFVHPGEKARRRDPRVYSYLAVPCPDVKQVRWCGACVCLQRTGSRTAAMRADRAAAPFHCALTPLHSPARLRLHPSLHHLCTQTQNQACPRGDSCQYCHSVFEYWLHPSRYRTQLCQVRASDCSWGENSFSSDNRAALLSLLSTSLSFPYDSHFSTPTCTAVSLNPQNNRTAPSAAARCASLPTPSPTCAPTPATSTWIRRRLQTTQKTAATARPPPSQMLPAAATAGGLAPATRLRRAARRRRPAPCRPSSSSTSSSSSKPRSRRRRCTTRGRRGCRRRCRLKPRHRRRRRWWWLSSVSTAHPRVPHPTLRCCCAACKAKTCTLLAAATASRPAALHRLVPTAVYRAMRCKEGTWRCCSSSRCRCSRCRSISSSSSQTTSAASWQVSGGRALPRPTATATAWIRCRAHCSVPEQAATAAAAVCSRCRPKLTQQRTSRCWTKMQLRLRCGMISCLWRSKHVLLQPFTRPCLVMGVATEMPSSSHRRSSSSSSSNSSNNSSSSSTSSSSRCCSTSTSTSACSSRCSCACTRSRPTPTRASLSRASDPTALTAHRQRSGWSSRAPPWTAAAPAAASPCPVRPRGRSAADCRPSPAGLAASRSPRGWTGSPAAPRSPTASSCWAAARASPAAAGAASPARGSGAAASPASAAARVEASPAAAASAAARAAAWPAAAAAASRAARGLSRASSCATAAAWAAAPAPRSSRRWCCRLRPSTIWRAASSRRSPPPMEETTWACSRLWAPQRTTASSAGWTRWAARWAATSPCSSTWPPQAWAATAGARPRRGRRGAGGAGRVLKGGGCWGAWWMRWCSACRSSSSPRSAAFGVAQGWRAATITRPSSPRRWPVEERWISLKASQMLENHWASVCISHLLLPEFRPLLCFFNFRFEERYCTRHPHNTNRWWQVLAPADENGITTLSPLSPLRTDDWHVNDINRLWLYPALAVSHSPLWHVWDSSLLLYLCDTPSWRPSLPPTTIASLLPPARICPLCFAVTLAPRSATQSAAMESWWMALASPCTARSPPPIVNEWVAGLHWTGLVVVQWWYTTATQHTRWLRHQKPLHLQQQQGFGFTTFIRTQSSSTLIAANYWLRQWCRPLLRVSLFFAGWWRSRFRSARVCVLCAAFFIHPHMCLSPGTRIVQATAQPSAPRKSLLMRLHPRMQVTDHQPWLLLSKDCVWGVGGEPNVSALMICLSFVPVPCSMPYWSRWWRGFTLCMFAVAGWTCATVTFCRIQIALRSGLLCSLFGVFTWKSVAVWWLKPLALFTRTPNNRCPPFINILSCSSAHATYS